jgi:hypothetical protein
MPRIEMDHDRDTGTWSVVTADQRHVFRTRQVPDCDTWWAWLRAQSPEEAEQFRGEDVRSDFGTAVASVQSGCQCKSCRDAVHARQLAETSATQRTLIAGSRRRDQVALYVQESSEPVAFASISDPPGTVRPLTYKRARAKYMDTGTITDKEAMLACVTMTVPDLDTIGTDWEPAKPKPEPVVVAPKPRIARNACRISPCGAGALLSALAVTAVLPKAFSVLAVVCALASVVLGFMPKGRR